MPGFLLPADGRRLGLRPHDPAMFAKLPLLDAHPLGQESPPPELSQRANLSYSPQMDLNNLIGDCGPVGVANGARAVAALGGYGVGIPTPAVVDLYSRFGYDAGQTATDGSNPTDQGVVLLSLLRNMLAQAWVPTPQLPLCGPWVTVVPDNRKSLALLMARIGWALCGFNLAESDQQPGVLDINPPATAGNPAPGSWGLHCAVPLWYDGLDDTSLVYIASWGMILQATWRWVRSRLVEAYGVLWRPLAGLDFDRINSMLALLGPEE